MLTESACMEGRRTAVYLRSRRDVERAARAALANHDHFRGRSEQFAMTVIEEMLVVRGAVPSFYLKQLLQSVLKKVDGVRRVYNQVVVINSQGLSSVATGGERRDRNHGSPITSAFEGRSDIGPRCAYDEVQARQINLAFGR